MDIFIKCLKERGFNKMAKELNNNNKVKSSINKSIYFLYKIAQKYFPKKQIEEIQIPYTSIENINSDTIYRVYFKNSPGYAETPIKFNKEEINKIKQKIENKVESSDWEGEDRKLVFEIGDMVKISEDEYYGGKIGEVIDNDIERDMYNPSGNDWMQIYKIEGEGIDPESAESWVSEYNLEKVEGDKIESAEKNDIDDLREQAKYILINNPIRENEIEMYMGKSEYQGTSDAKRNPHGIPKDIWQQVWKENEDNINIKDNTKEFGDIAPKIIPYKEWIKEKNINSADDNLKLRRKLDDLKEDRFQLEKKLNKSLGEKDKEQTKGLLRRLEEIHNEIKKIEDKNKEKINSAEEGAKTMKQVSDIIPLIDKMEVDYYISLDGNWEGVNKEDVMDMTNDHYMLLSDKEFFEKWNQKGYSLHPHGDYDEASNNYDELWFGLSYYIYTKDGGLITVDYHDWREDTNGVEEIRDSSAQAEEIFKIIESQNTWDIDIDTLVEKVNKKEEKEIKSSLIEDMPFDKLKHDIVEELSFTMLMDAHDQGRGEEYKEWIKKIENSKTKEEMIGIINSWEPKGMLELVENLLKENKVEAKKNIKAEEGNPTGYEIYNDGALIKYDEAKILEDFKNEHTKKWKVFEDIRSGEEGPISVLKDIMKKDISAIDNWIDSMDVTSYEYDIAMQSIEEFFKENDINEEHVSDDIKDEMRYHIEGLANYNVEDLFSYPVLLKKVMAEVYTETGVVVGYDNIVWTPKANKWKKEALKYVTEEQLREVCNNATYGGMAFIGGIVNGSEIIEKMYDGEKNISVDTAIIGIHDSMNGSGYYVEGNGNPVMDIKTSELDSGSYSLGAVFGTGEWVYASKKNNNIKAEKSNVQSMVSGYLETMLWSSNDESTPSGGEPMDENYSIIDISDETKEKAKKDCVEFAKQAGDLLKDKISAEDWWDVGHNFWLTRNGHGAGFWDSDNYEKEIGKKLTEISKKFGEKSPYVGDDEKIYASKNIKSHNYKDYWEHTCPTHGIIENGDTIDKEYKNGETKKLCKWCRQDGKDIEVESKHIYPNNIHSDDHSGEDYINEIKVTYEDGKEQIYKINELYGGLGILTTITRTAYKPAECYLEFENGAGGAEGYITVGKDNEMEDTETGEMINIGKVKSIEEMHEGGEGIESAEDNKSMEEKADEVWQKANQISYNENYGQLDKEELDKLWYVVDGLPIVLEKWKRGEGSIKDLTEQSPEKIEEDINRLNIDMDNIIKKYNMEIELLASNKNIKSYDPTIHGTRTEVKCNIKINLGQNIDTPELVAKELNETMIGGDKLDIYTFATSSTDNMVEFWPKITTNINFSDYKDEQEIIDWFINQIKEEVGNEIESLFGQRVESIEVSNIEFIKKHGIPVSQIVESSDTGWHIDVKDEPEKDKTEIDSDGDPIEYEYSWFISYNPKSIILYHGGDEHETKLPINTPFKDVMKKLKQISRSKKDYAVYVIKNEGDKPIYIGNTSAIDDIDEILLTF
jgi:hypothetical protein